MAYRDDPQVQSMISNMPAKTGKPLAAWFKVLAASKLEKHGAMMRLLKGDHAVGHGYANAICLIYREEHAAAAPPADPVALHAKKEGLKPIYDVVLTAAVTLGQDVVVAPKKKNVSLRRKKQFALIQPTTKTRIDLGIQLKGVAPQGKLEDGRMWNGMCSHRIQLASVEDVDAEVLEWLARAYEAAG